MREQNEILVRVLEGGRSAEIRMPSGLQPSLLTIDALCALAREAGVQLTAEVERALNSVITDYSAKPAEFTRTIARAHEPKHGVDGAWAWEPGLEPKPQTTEAPGTPMSAKSLISVAAGTRIARITAPTPGEDGIDVTGAVIPARDGRVAPIQGSEGTTVQKDGTVIAERDGAIVFAGGRVIIKPIRFIPGSVDVSTGNIEFKGSVEVAESVRDGLHIKATVDVTIHGPVEGATITAGHDLTCARGIASGIGAHIDVGRDADIGFMDHVHAIVRGRLHVRGEIMDCHVVVGGQLHCETGSVIGGSLASTGDAWIGSVGSPGWVPTLLHVGELPVSQAHRLKLEAETARTEKVLSQKKQRVQELSRLGSHMSAKLREELTEIQYELSELQREHEECAAQLEKVREEMKTARRGSLHVLKCIYPHVRVTHAGVTYEFSKETKGPLELLVDGVGGVLVRIGSSPSRPIREFAHAVHIEAAPKKAA